jgi:hypothetical protein
MLLDVRTYTCRPGTIAKHLDLYAVKGFAPQRYTGDRFRRPITATCLAFPKPLVSSLLLFPRKHYA